jgi:pyruvate dehydrogenase E2 component (dihydrolipoyllysine-residue acetyltransferase)
VATTVLMPHMGESVVEGTVLRWLRREGEAVKRNETIAEVETDKADVEIPAPADGRLVKILVPEGARAAVGAELALIEPTGAAETKSGEAPPPSAPAPAQGALAPPPQAVAAPRPAPARPPAPEVPPPPSRARPAGRAVVSPVVAKLMEQHQLTPADLERIPGTGIGGRVTKQDLLGYLDRRREAAEPPLPAPVPERPAQAEAGAPPATARGPAAAPAAGEETREEPVEEVRLEGLRKAIAEHMVASVRTAPHVTTVAEVDMTDLVRFRAYHKTRFEAEEGAPLTYLLFIVRAVIEGLRAFPMLNSSLDGDRILVRHYYHVGVAVATSAGLIVPVLRHADRMSIREMARTLHDLVERGRARKLRPDELSGGTFTVTNPGVFGGVLSTPIIHQPQAAILGVQAIRTQPAVRDGQIVPRELMYLCLSYDHRIVDGATAVQFLQQVRGQLEHPLALVI